jgi:hypothetical protein
VDGGLYTCQDELDCRAAPTAACCDPAILVWDCALSASCYDAGFAEGGCP